MDNTARLTTAAQVCAFALAGNARLTLVSEKTGTRFTFRIACPINKDTGEADRGIHFVSLLDGPDNTADFAYVGYIRRGVFFHGGAKARVGREAPSVRAFMWAWQRFVQDSLPDGLEVWHEGRCGRCGRALTVPSSIASGFGPECIHKVGFSAEECGA